MGEAEMRGALRGPRCGPDKDVPRCPWCGRGQLWLVQANIPGREAEWPILACSAVGLRYDRPRCRAAVYLRLGGYWFETAEEACQFYEAVRNGTA